MANSSFVHFATLGAFASITACTPDFVPPPASAPYVDVHLVEAPSTTVLTQYAGVAREGKHRYFLPGALVCRGVPCDGRAISGSSIVASSPDFTAAVAELPAHGANVFVDPGSSVAATASPLLLGLGFGAMTLGSTVFARAAFFPYGTTTEHNLALAAGGLTATAGTGVVILAFMLLDRAQTKIHIVPTFEF